MRAFFVQIKCELGKSYEVATAIADAEIHMSPTDPQGPKPVSWTPGATAAHYFQLGTMASTPRAISMLLRSTPLCRKKLHMRLTLSRVLAASPGGMANISAE